MKHPLSASYHAFVCISILFSTATIVLPGCTTSLNNTNNSIASTWDNRDSLIPDQRDSMLTKSFRITYHFLALNDSVITHLKSDNNTTNEIEIILALNRIDRSHLRKADTLVVPDTFIADLKKYSPFPDNVESIKPINKIIFVSYPAEAFAAYENGKLVRWGPASLGKRSTPTETGLFFTNWKAKQHTSTVNEEWIMEWYFNIDNLAGVSLHQYDLPGFPASHSCVRLSADDAQWIYNWADQWRLDSDNQTIIAYGTPVIIFGSYPFGQHPCWKSFSADDGQCKISGDSLDSLVKNFLPAIIEKQASRALPDAT